MPRSAPTIGSVKADVLKRYKTTSELFPSISSLKKISSVSSGNSIIDAISGVGGYPRGRVTEIYGGYSCGKTTLAIEACVALQRANPSAACLFVDYEHAFDPRYAQDLGLDLSEARFVFVQPDHLEQGVQTIQMFVENNLVDIVVLDSGSAAVPQAEYEGDLDPVSGGTQKGLQAAKMSQFLGKITKLINMGRKPPLIFINQTRAKFVIGRRASPSEVGEQSAGGNALKFYSTIRLELELIKSDLEESSLRSPSDSLDVKYDHNRVRVTCIKNKVAPPFRRGILTFAYGSGTDRIQSLFELAKLKLGIIGRTGHYTFRGSSPATTVSGRGTEELINHIRGNAALANEIEERVIATIVAEKSTSSPPKSVKSTQSPVTSNKPQAPNAHVPAGPLDDSFGPDETTDLEEDGFLT